MENLRKSVSNYNSIGVTCIIITDDVDIFKFSYQKFKIKIEISQVSNYFDPYRRYIVDQDKIITSAITDVLILRFSLFTPEASTGIKLEGSNLPKIYFHPFPRSKRSCRSMHFSEELSLSRSLGRFGQIAIFDIQPEFLALKLIKSNL